MKDYQKPGPGVPKNAPRKKGPARFFEIVGRDFGSLVKLNLLFALCALPAEALFALSLVSRLIDRGALFLLFAALGVAAGGLIGPAYTAMYAMMSRMLRDEPFFFWHDYKAKFRENFKATWVPGMVFSLLVGSQLYVYFYYVTGGVRLGFVLVIACVFVTLLLAMAAPYYFLQAACVDLKPASILKNSLLFAFGYAPRSLAGAAFGAGLLIVQILLLPPAVVVTVVAGYAFPALLNLMWIWPPVDKTFKIEETLREKRLKQESATQKIDKL